MSKFLKMKKYQLLNNLLISPGFALLFGIATIFIAIEYPILGILETSNNATIEGMTGSQETTVRSQF